MEHAIKAEQSGRYRHGDNCEISNVDWREAVIGKQGEGIQAIEYLAERRFNQGVLAEESVNYVLEKISQNNWQKCSSFKGDANPKTFVRRIIVNLLEEFSRKRFGRPRPPSWVQRQGDIWVKLWKELYLDRQLLPSIIDRYASQGIYDEDWIKQATTTIKARIPSCGQLNLEAICIDDIVAASNQAMMEERNNPIQGSTVAHEQAKCGYHFELSAQAEIILMLQAVIEEPLPSTLLEPISTGRVKTQIQPYYNDKLEQFSHNVQLSNEELTLLRMAYRDGLSRPAIGKALGLNNYQTNMRLKDTLARIRAAIEDCGLDLESLLAQVLH